MFFFGILMLLFIAVFFAANFASAIAALVGLGMVLLQLAHRNKSFWPWLIAVVLFLGGAGSLGGGWGLYYAVNPSWPHSNWPEIAWIAGYLVGGAVGVTLGGVEVIRWKGDDVKRVIQAIKDFVYTAREDLAEIPY